jgi:hypothetical protein
MNRLPTFATPALAAALFTFTTHTFFLAPAMKISDEKIKLSPDCFSHQIG